MEYFIKDTKKKEIELKLFVLFLRSVSGKETFLYTGVHYSLEDAFGEARDIFFRKSASGEQGVDLDSWDIITFDQIYENFSGKHMEKLEKERGHHIAPEKKSPSFPQVRSEDMENSFRPLSVKEIAQKIMKLKDQLMKKLIEEKDLSAISTMKKILTSPEIIYIQKTITTDMALKQKKKKNNV